MNIGEVTLSTSVNHLSSFNEDTDSFIIPTSDADALRCNICTDAFQCLQDCRVEHLATGGTNCQPAAQLWNDVDDQYFVLLTEAKVLKDTAKGIVEHSFQPAQVPVLGYHCFDGVVVTVTSSCYTVYELSSSDHYTNPISSIKACTALCANWQRDPVTCQDITDIHRVEILLCDGSQVYYYSDYKVSVIDFGKALTFCKTAFGYLAAFETTWRLSPMNLFSDQAINIESLEIPRNNRTSNEARLQMYGWDLDPLHDHNLPAHNEPTLCVHRADVVCVSGFYKHVISIFHLKNGMIIHLKDFSIGKYFRCAGLAFRNNDLLVLKRKFSSDSILLTFPSKCGTVSCDPSVDSIKLKEHIGDIMQVNKVKPKKRKQKLSKELYSPDFPFPKFVDHSHLTRAELQERANKMVEHFRERVPSIGSFSDSDLSEGTLEILAECKPRTPFIPIPVSDSSDEKESELSIQGKLIVPSVKKSEEMASELRLPGKLIIPSVRQLASNSKFISVIGEEILNSDEIVDSKGNENECSNSQQSHIENKLDKIIELLGEQNKLLTALTLKSSM